MGDHFLTDRDTSRIRAMLQWFDRNKNNPGNFHRRRNITTGASGPGVAHRAFVKDAPGAQSNIACYLDTDETGDVIDVLCSIFPAGTTLDNAIPRLEVGGWITVAKISRKWRCQNIFQKSMECP